MSFFGNLLDSAKRKSAEIKERNEFLAMVEDKARPIRRAAYMEEMLKHVVEEGKAKAIADSEAKIQKEKETRGFWNCIWVTRSV